MKMKSPAFEAGGRIPKKYTGEGEDVSPPLSWTDVPDGTKEFALVCEDPDAPQDEPWVHWVVYGIAANRPSLTEATAGGGFEGKNSFDRSGYNGPMPPRGHGVHRYHFKLFALDETTSLPTGFTKADLLQAVEGHVLDTAEIVGTYER